MSLLTILYWVILVLAAIGYFGWPANRYITGSAWLALFIIIGLRVFRTSVQIGLFAIGLSMLTMVSVSQAQTNPPVTSVPAAPTVSGLGDTLKSWVSSYNTNLFYQDIITWDGAVFQSGVNVGNELGVSVDLWHQHSATNATQTLFVAVEGRARQGAIAGAFVSEGLGAEVGYQKYDLRIGVYMDGLHRETDVVGPRGFAGEFGIFADKMMTANSAIGMFIAEQTGTKSSAPLIGANLSLSFGNGNGFLGLFNK